MLWIPGAKGLVGSALLSKCSAISTGHEVDIGNLDALRAFVADKNITHIVNCAVYSQVDKAEIEKEEAFRTNVVGAENCAIVALELGAKLVHISTDYIFPGTGSKPLKEDDPTGPCNYYGVTKLEGEQRVLKTLPTACVIRTSWIFGLGGKNFLARMLQMLRNEKEIRMVDDQWSRFTSVYDLVDVILKMKDRSGVYHFANSGIATRYELACEMKRLCNSTAQIIPVPGSSFPAACKRPRFTPFDTTKIEQEIDIRPWQEALEEFLCEHSDLSS